MLHRQLPTFLPLSEAARQFNLSEKALTQLIETGKIQAVQTPDGELLVAADNNGQHYQTKDEIIAKHFAHLRGEPITVTEAARAYGLSRNTILEWVKRKYIAVLKPGYRMQLDKADVAYCAKIYKQKLQEYGGEVRGVNIFDKYGNPYQLRHPHRSKQHHGN